MDKSFGFVIAFALLLCSGFVCAEAQPWDALRPLNAAAESLQEVTTWLVFLLSIGLMAIACMAWRKKRTKRYFFIGLAFFFSFFKWLLAVVDLYVSPGFFFNWAGGTVVELVIFACLFLALFKR